MYKRVRAVLIALLVKILVGSAVTALVVVISEYAGAGRTDAGSLVGLVLMGMAWGVYLGPIGRDTKDDLRSAVLCSLTDVGLPPLRPDPGSTLSAIRLHRAYTRADEAAVEVFRTLVEDGSAPRDIPACRELLHMSQHLAGPSRVSA